MGEPFDLKIGERTIRVVDDECERRVDGVLVTVRLWGRGWTVRLDGHRGYGVGDSSDVQSAANAALAEYRRDARDSHRRAVREPGRTEKRIAKKVADLRKQIEKLKRAGKREIARDKAWIPKADAAFAKAQKAFS